MSNLAEQRTFWFYLEKAHQQQLAQNPMKDILIIGMSPGNGYFKQVVIDKLIPYGLKQTEEIGIFIPDIPAVSTYIALGYSENIARREKAIPQGNSFRNRIIKTIQEQRLDTTKIIVFNWQKEGIEGNPKYQECYHYLKDLYQNNPNFQKDINDATEPVLSQNQFKKKEITQDDVKVGTHYILSEFAFMMFLPTYLTEYENFIYGYHNPWPVWEKFIAGEYDEKKRGNLKFFLLPNFS